MVYSLRILGTGKGMFYRDFEIKATQTFYDFHIAIQDELGYDKKQMASFFLANNKWEKGLEINIFDMTEDTHTPVIIMDRTQLCELLSEEKQRLLYVFDFFSDRAFYIELVNIFSPGKNREYPCCTGGTGDPPPQIIYDEPGMSYI